MSATLAACGGGSDDPPSPPPPAAGVILSGSAAGTTIEAKCQGATGSTTASPSGSYSLTLNTGSLPCVLRATGGSATVHGLAVTSGTAHLSLMSELVLGSLAGQMPDAFYGSFDSTGAAALTPAASQASQDRVVALLKAGGEDFSGFSPVLNQTLEPGSSFVPALSALEQRLGDRSLSLAEFTAAVVRASPSNPTPTVNTPLLPAQALLQPAAPSCGALRSGTYRIITPHGSNAGDYSTGTFVLDAPLGRYVNDEGQPGSLTSTGPCSFTNDDDGGEVVVSPAGVVVMRTRIDGQLRLGFAFPEQAHAVADLAGAWQSLGFDRDDATARYAAVSSRAAIAANGAFTVNAYCADVKNCATPASPPSIALAAHSDGGFNLTNATAGWTDRVFAYRAGSGDLMVVDLAGNGSFAIWTRQRNNGPSALNSRSASWGLWSNSSLVSTAAVSVSDFTTTASDTATGSWTRISNLDGHVETLTANTPHPGWSFRAEGTATTTGGATVTVREFSGLLLRGMGLSVLSMPSLGGGAYFVSVTQP